MTKRTSVKSILVLTISFCIFLFYGCNHTDNKEENPQTEKKKVDELAIINDSIAANPNNAPLYFRRAQIFIGKKDLKQAYIDINKAVSIDSTNYDYYMLLADVSFQGLLIQKAIPAFEKAISIDPQRIEAHLKLSELYLYLKAYPRCLSEASAALKINKNTTKAYFIKGFAYKELGDTAKAISSFQTVIEIDPDYYDAHIQLGNIEAARKHTIALQYYNNARKLQPLNTEALYNRGLLFQNMGELDKAIEDYNTLLKIDNTYSDAHYNLGYIDLAFKKNYKSAITHFTDAIRVNEHYAEAFYNRGLCYENLGDQAAADKDFRKALEIVPNFELAKERLKGR